MCTLLASCLGPQVVADHYVNNTHWTWAGKCVQVLCILKKYYTLKLFFPLLWLKNPNIGHLILLNNFSEGQAFWINWGKTNCVTLLFSVSLKANQLSDHQNWLEFYWSATYCLLSFPMRIGFCVAVAFLGTQKMSGKSEQNLWSGLKMESTISELIS